MPRRNALETVREEAVNTMLARMLRGYGVSARAERRSRMGAPDVRAELRTGDSVLIECKWAGSERDLEEQLDERLVAFPESLGLIGVLYPDRMRHMANVEAALETARDLRWWLHGSRGQSLPDRPVRSGSVSDLADNLRAIPLELEGPDRVTAAAEVVGYAIEQSAQEVAKHARMSYRIADIIAKTDQEKNHAAALRIGCLVLFNALAFQDRLAAINGNVPTVRESWGSGVHRLRDAWRDICDEIDYVPVFDLAAGILDILGDGPEDTHSSVMNPSMRAKVDCRQNRFRNEDGTLRLPRPSAQVLWLSGAVGTQKVSKWRCSYTIASLSTTLSFRDAVLGYNGRT